jgi:predicted ATPase
LAAAGDLDGALALYDDALEIASTNGEHWYESELLRLKAEMLLAQPKPRTVQADQCLTAAISLAQKQEAKFWELRAAATLAELWAHQKRPSEARDLLAPVYGWFTEGFDTLDLKEAKALLDELNA